MLAAWRVEAFELLYAFVIGSSSSQINLASLTSNPVTGKALVSLIFHDKVVRRYTREVCAQKNAHG